MHLIQSLTTPAILATLFTNPASANPIAAAEDSSLDPRAGDVLLRYECKFAFAHKCNNAVDFAITNNDCTKNCHCDINGNSICNAIGGCGAFDVVHTCNQYGSRGCV